VLPILAMNAEDAAELMRRLAALEAEVNRRPTEPVIQAEIARQISMNNDNLTAIRVALEGLGAAQRPERLVGNHVKAKDLMPREWAGEANDAQGFSEYSFKLVGWMRRAYDRGGEMMMAVDGMEDYDYDDVEEAAATAQEALQAKKDLYAIMSKTMGGKAHILIKNTVSGDGFEAWHKVLREYDPRNALDKNAAYAQVASPEKRATSDDQLKEFMTEWEAAVNKYEVRWAPLPDETKVSAIKAIIPYQLLENRFRGTTGLTFARIKREVENYLNDKPHAADRKARPTTTPGKPDRSQGPTAMDTSALDGGSGGPSGSGTTWDVNAFGQWHNPKGGWTVKGLGKKGASKGDKGAGKGQGKSGWFSKGKGKGKYGDGKGAGKGPGGAPDHRQCYNCGGYGHIAAKCPSWTPGGLSTLEEEALAPDDMHEQQPDYPMEAEQDVPCWTMMREDEYHQWERVHKVQPHGTGRSGGEISAVGQAGKDKELNVVETLGKWVKIAATVDSAAAETVCPPNMLPMVEPTPGKDERYYVAANGARIKDLGEKPVEFKTSEGYARKVKFRVANVMKPLISVSRINEAGDDVVFKGPNPHIKCKDGRIINLRKERGVFVLDMWVDTETHGPGFTRQGQ